MKWKKHLLKQAKEIHELHRKYVVNDITFEDYGFSMGRCVVHNHSDTYSVGVCVDGMFSDGSVEINSDGRVNLIIKTDPKNSARLATQAIDKFLEELKAALKDVDLDKVESEKKERLKELKSEIELLEGSHD